MSIRCLTQPRGYCSAAFFYVLVLLPLIGTLSAASDPSAGNRVWVADHKAARGVDIATNQVVATIALKHKADRLAIDPSDRALWVLSHGELFKFNEQGSTVLGIESKSLGLQGNPDILALNPYDGSVWVGSQRSLLHLNADGTKRTAFQTIDKLRDVKLDIDESVWGLTKHALLHFGLDGTVLSSVDLKSLKIKPRRLAIDSLGGWVWISTRAYLYKFKVSDLTVAPQSIQIPGTNETDDDDGDDQEEDPRTVAIAVHPVFGTLFVATRNSLLLYDRAGSILKNVDLRSFKLNHPHDLAYDPVSGSVWLGGHKALLRFSTNGDFLAGVSLDDKSDAIGVTPFLLRPTVSLISPVDNSLTNNPRPLVQLGLGASCNGTPCTLADAYIRSLMLDVTLNGVQIGPLFSIGSSEAQFLPSSPLPEGANSLLSKAKDLFGHSSDIFLTRFIVDTIAPQFVELEPQNGTVFIAPQATIKGRVDDPNASVALLDGAGKGLGLQGANFRFAVTLKEGTNSFTLVATDAANNSTSQPLGLVLNSLPPDPGTVAPPVDRGVATVLSASTAFLYSGPNPIQRGVAPGTIDPKRAAVVRGKALTRDNKPLPGVRITILNHPEFGYTLSRTDGAFDLAVNGGGVLTVNYNKAGYLAAQRQVNAPWQDFIHAPDVVLIPLDSQVSAISMSAASMQVARGSVSTDADGTRRATLLFPAGTTATMTLPDGTTRALSTLSVRATEYTVGPNGPKAMPAPLPPTSGYTYAVELSADEAIAANAKIVKFNQPIIQYVENFLNFPVGEIVPAGYYDFGKAAWIASDNGRVVKILSVAGGTTQIDSDGDGASDDGAALGISMAERQQLASLYAAGDSLWRIPIPHFTPWDYNWPYGPPQDAVPPPDENPEKDENDRPDEPECKSNSIVECQSQVLRETVAITGTPYSLNYRSDRVPGRITGRKLNIRLSGSSVPASLRRIELEITIAGKRSIRNFTPSTNLIHTFEWDGTDVYGRPVLGAHTATVHVGYVYGLARYFSPATFAQSFGMLGSARAIGVRPLLETTLWRDWSESLTVHEDARGRGLGGWSIDVHHYYEPLGGVLALGLGSNRTIDTVGPTIQPFAGGSSNWCGALCGSSGDGGLATRAQLGYPYQIAAGRDGSIYIADSQNRRVRRVGPTGIITTVAGNGISAAGGDGGPATSAGLSPEGVAIGPDGSIYIADSSNHRVRRVTPDGVINTIAGNGVAGYAGDGGPGPLASLWRPTQLAVTSDGTVYIADRYNNRIRRIGPDGVIATFAGNGMTGFSGDGGPAALASLNTPMGVAVAPDGAVYIADTGNSRVRRVGVDGVITTVAGIGTAGYGGDNGPAIQAQLNHPGGVSIDPSGNILIADSSNNRIRFVTANGTIRTIVGSGSGGFFGDNDYPHRASLASPQGIAVGPDGSLYVSDTQNHRVRRVGRLLPPFTGQQINIASDDGAQLFVFDGFGRHLRTLNTFTGATVRSFEYDASGYLARVVDGDGNAVAISRDARGNPTAITSSDGLVTRFTVDGAGYLTSLTNPAGERRVFAYDAGGLMQSHTTPRGHTATMMYDVLGRLIRDQNPAGGAVALSREVRGVGQRVTFVSAENRTTFFDSTRLSSGDTVQRVTIAPDGTRATSTMSYGEQETTHADGTVRSQRLGPDPRFGMQAPSANAYVNTRQASLGVSSSRSVTLTDTQNPLSLVSLVETTLINGNQHQQHYDAATRTFTTTTPTQRRVVTTIDPQGRPLRTQQGDLEAVDYTYDARGRLVSVTQGVGADQRTTKLSYDSYGNLANLTDAMGRIHRFQYDPAGRMTQQALPDGRLIEFAYDPNGNLTAITPPGRPAHGFDYTPVDLEAAYLAPPLPGISATTRYRYNGDKQLVAIDRPDGITIPLNYDTAGRPSDIVLPQGQLRYGYSPTTGQVNAITTPNGDALGLDYDGFLLTRETWSGTVTGQVGRTYDNNFRVTALDVNGAALPFVHDTDGLLTQAGTLALTRDANGLITDTRLGRLESQATYNRFGEPASAVFRSFPSLTLALDTTTVTADTLRIEGRVTDASRVVVNGIAMTLSPDGTLTGEVPLPNFGSNTIMVDVYDQAGVLVLSGSRTVFRHPPDQPLPAMTPTRDAYAFADTAGASLPPATHALRAQPDWLATLTEQTASAHPIQGTLRLTGTAGAVVYSANYARDALGRLTQQTDTVAGTTVSYTYDQAGRLTTVTANGTTTTYTYDTNGNRLSQTTNAGTITASYDDQDRLVAYGNNTYTYTANGELRTKTTGTQTTTYTYDPLGNLTQATLPNGTAIEYVIDGRNRRIGKRVNGTLTQAFLYQDQLRPIAELDASGNIVSRFIYADKPNVPAYLIKGTITYRLITDHVGSPRLIVNTQTGEIAQRLDYDEFGNITQDTNPGFQPFGFAGGLHDPHTKLIRFGARDYDPEVGRWTIKDPIRFDGGDTNLYGYVLSDPVNWIDPRGFAKDSITASVESAIIRGDAQALRNLLETGALNPAQQAAAQQGLRALDILSKSTGNVGELASTFGRSAKQIKDAIHACKNNLPRSGPQRNPDVIVDKTTGEVYPRLSDGRIGDSIGNILEHLK